jgi:PPOX class probable F420-dependent enzyme
MGIRLSDDELWDFLRGAHTGIVTTLRRDGTPVSLPMWFVALDRRIYLRTPERASKVARLRRDSRVGFLVEAGLRWAELKAVHLTGRAEIVESPEEQANVTAALEAKYRAFRTPRADQPEATRKHYGVEWVTLRIVPDDRMLSWDNAKLRLREARRS